MLQLPVPVAPADIVVDAPREPTPAVLAAVGSARAYAEVSKAGRTVQAYRQAFALPLPRAGAQRLRTHHRVREDGWLDPRAGRVRALPQDLDAGELLRGR